MAAEPASPAPTTKQGPADGCRLDALPGVVWHGTETKLSLARLAAYAAPIYWFSPDEPRLRSEEAGDIQLPQALPFQPAAATPVVYYQFDEVSLSGGDTGRASLQRREDPGDTEVDLRYVTSFQLDFFAYFPTEQGVGAHTHDVETAEFKAIVVSTASEVFQEFTGLRCSPTEHVVLVTRVSGKAHGLFWYWNVSDTDEDTRFPMHLLVEEGKHALGTDKNGDGYYTPGYDVSRSVNDAWGVRDATRGGQLFSGSYQAWMTKVRRPEDRLFPPLPEDSPLRAALKRREGAGARAEYTLRPLPPAAQARSVPGLSPFLEDKEVPGWPEIKEAGTLEDLGEWVEADRSLRSLSLSFYADGDVGLSFVFPFLVVKNLELPVAGGYLVHRMYLKDDQLRDLGWMALYTPSASRWFDTYFAAGVEWDLEESGAGTRRRTDFVMESGIKFRVNISRSPVSALRVLTDFWGLRLGIKSYGFFDVDRLTYVFEVGAGTW
ncbi:hypothetical protein HPC49_00440 [Pyxidicoccus fallax]|uniref:Uncharacterized protein n=1 Tax=Pyxidicoccus fallax TaxID=394095 RepID=A0A848L3Q8_9BACT|nr:hypothetical protein [Pyxidicoccus fallax]NMO13570.1 hypothetical protein [Pyxidicoccus fallax]NPC76722.1 hypothetical protein [Pyxidicoccus fallax]